MVILHVHEKRRQINANKSLTNMSLMTEMRGRIPGFDEPAEEESVLWGMLVVGGCWEISNWVELKVDSQLIFVLSRI